MSSPRRLSVPEALPTPTGDWLDWLKGRIDGKWKPGQWNPELWLFTGDPDDPGTAVHRCHVVACGTLIDKHKLCPPCERVYNESEMGLEEFTTTHQPTRRKRLPRIHGEEFLLCRVTHGRERCWRVASAHGVCQQHLCTWLRFQKREPQRSIDDWLRTQKISIPIQATHPECAVPACDRITRSSIGKLCTMHIERWEKAGRPPVDTWARTAPVYVARFQFSLVHLPDRLRCEMLYAVQQRSARGGRIYPASIRTLTRALEGEPSLATLTDTEMRALTAKNNESNTAAHLYEFRRTLLGAYDEFCGRSPHDRLVWDPVEVGLMIDPATRGGNRRRSGIDFAPLSQSWLRELTMSWARNQSDLRRVYDTLSGATLASQALRRRPDEGSVIANLDHLDVEHIVAAIQAETGPSGAAVSNRHKRRLYGLFFELVDFGRRNGHLNDLSMSFASQRAAAMFAEDAQDEPVGKALPEAIQRQLDAQIDALGQVSRYHKALPTTQRRTMFQALYCVMRDTGRRPLEVVSLSRDCLTRDTHGPILIYDNHKARRLGRKLPINQSTADTLRQWMDIRSEVTADKISDDYLFPGHTPHQPHMPTSTLAGILREWVASIERLDSTEVDRDGEPVPFDRSRIFPYAFRHSYAQRHADSGTPVDVLRELMDHKSVKTTVGYYSITAQRKRAAIDTIGKYTVSRQGTAEPLTQSVRYQMRSVAVPFGNCIEPANVQAGGHACPVRFQCAGCGFYRPDPSYIPAIEEHIASLRADRETAMALGTAEFVTANLAAQIDAYQHVLTTMRDNIAQLDDDERARVQEAAATLRKARAGMTLPLTVVRRPTHSEERQ
ncbi:hypothetical protein CRM90_29665 [Mycobacterium sp. ENV421]|uniref:tyrosine-type recombinase/integrase n=1 Tax=Mycobacterium sp. ENV421 TaxID=1213407 RepID=UPI000C9A19AD|nr:tyrosine-type recombinase/integrase [Mycobacterium sp. ENV421]PND54145.1 hypothetical protein CRM90_29665 [Mycobacterium sp. ENV421]